MLLIHLTSVLECRSGLKESLALRHEHTIILCHVKQIHKDIIDIVARQFTGGHVLKVQSSILDPPPSWSSAPELMDALCQGNDTNNDAPSPILLPFPLSYDWLEDTPCCYHIPCFPIYRARAVCMSTRFFFSTHTERTASGPSASVLDRVNEIRIDVCTFKYDIPTSYYVVCRDHASKILTHGLNIEINLQLHFIRK